MAKWAALLARKRQFNLKLKMTRARAHKLRPLLPCPLFFLSSKIQIFISHLLTLALHADLISDDYYSFDDTIPSSFFVFLLT